MLFKLQQLKRRKLLNPRKKFSFARKLIYPAFPVFKFSKPVIEYIVKRYQITGVIFEIDCNVFDLRKKLAIALWELRSRINNRRSTEMVSLGVMIKQLGGLTGTDDLNDWENEFVGGVVERTHDGKITGTLSNRQVETIERIWKRHFA